MKVTIRETPQLRTGAVRAIVPQMFELGHEIEREMLVHPWHNRTGITERSTASEVDNLTGKLTVGNNGHVEEGKKVPYWLEFGTSKMHARPWLLPALIRVSLRRKFKARGRRR